VKQELLEMGISFAVLPGLRKFERQRGFSSGVQESSRALVGSSCTGRFSSRVSSSSQEDRGTQDSS
jgi:hypothetical protein